MSYKYGPAVHTSVILSTTLDFIRVLFAVGGLSICSLVVLGDRRQNLSHFPLALHLPFPIRCLKVWNKKSVSYAEKLFVVRVRLFFCNLCGRGLGPSAVADSAQQHWQ